MTEPASRSVLSVRFTAQRFCAVLIRTAVCWCCCSSTVIEDSGMRNQISLQRQTRTWVVGGVRRDTPGPQASIPSEAGLDASWYW